MTLFVEDTGLRGVKAATTKISKVDGQNGILLYRGYRIEELARKSTFEETAYLLLHGYLPNKEQLEQFSEAVREYRKLPEDLGSSLTSLSPDTDPMCVLQASIPALSAHAPAKGETRECNMKKAIHIISSMPAIIAGWKRIKCGEEPLKPKEELSTAANFLYMFNGEVPDDNLARFMDIAMILHADHTFNASTFAARVVASTGANIYAAVSAGVGALSGPLHGGANAQVMRNLIDMNDPDKVEEWVTKQFERGKRVAGIGHAVYRTTDPRATILQEMAYDLLKDHPEFQWYEMTEKMAEVTQKLFYEKKGKAIYPNVDLYSASIYHAMGIHHDFFPPVFAMARAAGWAAHVIEEKFPDPPVKPVLYRPSSIYVGEEVREYVDISKR